LTEEAEVWIMAPPEAERTTPPAVAPSWRA
jgi:hypothetical protein